MQKKKRRAILLNTHPICNLKRGIKSLIPYPSSTIFEFLSQLSPISPQLVSNFSAVPCIKVGGLTSNIRYLYLPVSPYLFSGNHFSSTPQLTPPTCFESDRFAADGPRPVRRLFCGLRRCPHENCTSHTCPVMCTIFPRLWETTSATCPSLRSSARPCGFPRLWEASWSAEQPTSTTR